MRDWWSTPLPTWPRSRGARCQLVWTAPCLTQASCQRIVGAAPMVVLGLQPVGKGIGKGWSWEGVGAGQHREYFFNRYCPSKWKRGDFKLIVAKET